MSVILNCNLQSILLLTLLVSVLGLKPCPGETRGTGQCNQNSIHRVCANVGDTKGNSFWNFTGQRSLCGTVGNYKGPLGSRPRCPPDKPTWCICKWKTAKWIKAKGCGVTARERLGATRKAQGWEVVATGEYLFSRRSNTANMHSIDIKKLTRDEISPIPPTKHNTKAIMRRILNLKRRHISTPTLEELTNELSVRR